jgi:hypothetical protein
MFSILALVKLISSWPWDCEQKVHAVALLVTLLCKSLFNRLSQDNGVRCLIKFYRIVSKIIKHIGTTKIYKWLSFYQFE